MVERKTSIRSSSAGGKISQSTASAPALSQISFANTVAEIGRGALRAGNEITEFNNAFERSVIEADNTAVYANSINKATIQYQGLFQQRINQVVDEDGNPTFSTLQDDVAEIGRNVLEETLNNIQSQEVRSKFQQNFESYTSNQQIASIGITRDQQLSFINESVSNSLNDLGTRAGSSSDEDSAFFENQAKQILDSAVHSGAMTPQQRFVAQDSFRKEVATARIRNSINQDSETALQIVTNSSAKDLGLTELERLSLQNEAQVAFNRDTRAKMNLDNEQNSYIKDQLRQFEKMIDLGQDIPQSSIDEISNIVVDTEFEPQFVSLFNTSRAINEFTMNDPTTRKTILNELMSDNELSIDGLELRKRLNTIHNSLNTKIDNDVYSLGIEQGIIPNVPPFDAKGDIQSQLADRQSSIGFIENHYKVRTSGLTNEEMNGFEEAYTDADYQKKASMLGDIVGGLGEGALSFLEQLAFSGSTETAAIGSLVYEGDSATAVTVLKGQDILKQQRDIIPRDYLETEQQVLENTLPFYDLPQQQEDIRNMAKAIYAANSFQSYDFGPDTDRDRLSSAVAQVSNGGSISYNSNNIEPPVNGMTSNEIKKWVRSITPQDIDKLGGWQGFDSMDIPRHLNNAELVTHGRGQYLVFLDGLPVLNKDGDAFILDYNIVESTDTSREPIEHTTQFHIQNMSKRFNNIISR